MGNSKGVRIPKKGIEKYTIEGELQITKSEEGMMVKPVSKARKEWDELFKEAKEASDPDDDFRDFMLVSHSFDSSEWKW